MWRRDPFDNIVVSLCPGCAVGIILGVGWNRTHHLESGCPCERLLLHRSGGIWMGLLNPGDKVAAMLLERDKTYHAVVPVPPHVGHRRPLTMS